MKRLIACLLPAILLIASFVAAAPKVDPSKADGYRIQVVTDRSEALYHVGEKAIFKITLTKDDKPVDSGKVAYVLTNDGVGDLGKGALDVTGQALEVSGTRDEPGFLRCQATYDLGGGKKIYALAGAGFDPEQIKASMAPPEDFDAFWADQLKQLAAVPMNAKLTPVDSGNPQVEAFDVELDCLGGAPVRGYYARPKGAKPGSAAAILNLHGAGVRSSSLSGPVGQAAKGRIAMDINAHGLENGKPAAFYDELSKGRLKDYRSEGKDDREKIYFRGMYLRLYRAMEFLMAQPEWDQKVLIPCGSSQGGGQALAAAGLNPKVVAFGASVPALCDHTGKINGWPRFLKPESGAPGDPKVVEAVRYIDAMNFAARTKARAILTVGFIDNTCRATSVYAAYNNLQGPKEIMTFPLMGHETRPEIYAAFEKMIAEEIAKAHGK